MKFLRASIVLAVFLIPAVFFAFPGEVRGITIFDPFGGRVVTWLPSAPACTPFTTAVCVATLGTVCPTVEELVVGPPKNSTLGILRVDGMLIPGLTTIYEKYSYHIPGTAVVGKSINICNICENLSGIPGVGAISDLICDLPVVSDIVDTICEFVGGSCPVGNLIYKMGTSGLPAF